MSVLSDLPNAGEAKLMSDVNYRSKIDVDEIIFDRIRLAISKGHTYCTVILPESCWHEEMAHALTILLYKRFKVSRRYSVSKEYMFINISWEE